MDLQNVITPKYAALWKVIGMQLSLPSGVLDIVEHDNYHRAIPCCNAMLEKWLEVDNSATWKKLLSVIQSPAVHVSCDQGN